MKRLAVISTSTIIFTLITSLSHQASAAPQAQQTVPASQTTENKAITVTSEQFKKFEGQYQAPGFVITIFQKDGKFLTQTPGQQSFELFADSATSFYAKVADIKISFVLGADGMASSFNISQNGKSMPPAQRIVDTKALAALVPKRPQQESIEKTTPNYNSSEVRFTNAKAQIELAGTMTIPKGTGPFPTVVLVHGSGPLDRNEELHKHKVFLVLADHLSKQGIAVLRYDKRGVAASKGDYKAATTFDFAEDTEAAIAYLRTRNDVDHKKIGIIGHSEGGLIAPLVAARDPQVKFIVLMGGPGIAIKSLMLEQSRLISAANGQSKEDIAENEAFLEKAYTVMNSGYDDNTITTQLTALFDQIVAKGDMPADVAKRQVATLSNSWFRSFIKYDPAPTLKKVNQAVLAVNGELDLQVAAKSNLAGLRDALKHNKKAVIRELPKLNHVFQTATTGSPSEYSKIEETIAPLALNTISDWIRQQ
nr:alpha/beta fold hydrolase [uncultured Undibacterium sp.]